MKNNRKKYVVMIMDRHYIAPEAFVFTSNHAVIGEIDAKTFILKDNQGNEYIPMLNEELLKSEIPYGYSTICELDALKQELGTTSIKECLSEYEYTFKKVLYFVFNSGKGKPKCLASNIDTLRKMSEENTDDANDIDDGYKENEITRLIADVVNGKYSIEELELIREDIKEQKEDINDMITTINTEIGALQNNEDFVTYARRIKNSIPKDVKEEIENEVAAENQKNNPKKQKKDNKKKINIEEVFNKVTKSLIAQDEPALRVISELARKELNAKKKREAILITGPTGVGKTELMRLIAKNIGRPFKRIDANQLTIAGYIGRDIEEELWDLYESCGKNLKKCEQAIVYFDEIDKKGTLERADVSGAGVLNLLLTFIEGSKYQACSSTKSVAGRQESVEIDTSNMIVIFSGAYTEVYKNLLEKNSIGFENSVYDKPTYREATINDFVENGGMTREFMGRVSVVKLNDLDIHDIKEILLKSDISALKIQEDIFNKIGTKITFTEGYIDKICKQVIENKTGARGLNDLVDVTTWKAFEDAYQHEGEYEEVIISEDSIEDPSKYQFIKKKK